MKAAAPKIRVRAASHESAMQAYLLLCMADNHQAYLWQGLHEVLPGAGAALRVEDWPLSRLRGGGSGGAGAWVRNMGNGG